ncbi:alpha-methylacyl-CoA racemase [Parathielavia appendiculata]|uniref:Alpha-methylacyl-CoA racemase n=1 Tax=Parathielavia appendiculata TaxID=2587402 RepID=A0AAN6U6Y1_9PEZI|nr:alpha-methylacyl-CoA racemase [Parathielavia appendiculata]
MAGQPPLTGIKVLEFAGLAPGPFAGLLLADAGASVLRIDRPPSQSSTPPAADLLTRRKRSIAVNLKDPAGVSLIRALVAQADVLIDPYRPGVLEKLGLGPADLCPLNGRLVYARLTGFRRDGRFASMAGHDINYLAVSGVLALLGRKGQPPTPPGNLLGDFAGGGAVLFQGILMALLARARTGRGQVVEANMVDGVSYLASFARFARRTPVWDRERGENLLDSGCPWYDAYETKDGRWMAVGALEPQFFAELVMGLGLAGQGWEDGRRYDRDQWPELRRVMEGVFKSKTRDEWERVFEGTDACCTPVYEYGEMEGGGRMEGDQRPAVALRATPCLAVWKNAADASHGQGKGIEGKGYDGYTLEPGHGGEETLKEWLDWSKGDQFDVSEGGLVLKNKAKL